MSVNKRFPGALKIDKAVYVAFIILISLNLFSGVCDAAQTSLGGAASFASPMSAQVVTYPSQINASTGVVFESQESATLILTKPSQSSLIPYDERRFNQSVEASIAWWMNPKFMDNTTEFRRYLRESDEGRAELYSPETQIFYNFITKNLDIAENASTLNETMILFRGISGSFADSVINNSEYVEPAFASTAYDIAVCLDLFGPWSDEGYQSVLVMQRSKGEHAIFINDDEREFLIPRGTKWAVIKAANIEKLVVDGNFVLHGCSSDDHQFDKVRLIYIKEIES